MNTRRRAPLWIRIPSYLFAMMGVICIGTMLMIAWYPQSRDKITISFISNSVRFTEHPVAFVGISALFIFASIVAFMILFRNRFAYHVGTAFCIAALTFLGGLTALDIGVVNEPSVTYMLLGVTFGGLGGFFLRHCNEWKRG